MHGGHESAGCGRKEDTMRRILIVCVSLALLGLAQGCFSYDTAHNARHWRMIRKDIRTMHEDMDFALGLDAPTHVSRSEY